MKSTTTAAVGAVLLLTASVGQASTITAWNFENLAHAINNTPAASTGTGSASALGMGVYATPAVGTNTDDVLAGVTGDTGSNTIANTSNIWRIRAVGGSGSAAANGWSSLAPIGTQGAQFLASTAGYTGITVSFDWYATNQGEAKLQFEYTTDGVNWINAGLSGGAGSGVSFLTNSASANTVKGAYVNIGTAGQNWVTGLYATITDPAAANDANFGIRLVNAATGADNVSAKGTALNNNSGNWRFDNVVIAGTVQTAVVPLPASAWLLGSGVMGLVALSRRRQAA